MDRRKFRAYILAIHRWLGLHACIVLGLIFTSGVMLIYSSELLLSGRPDLWIDPPEKAAGRATVGQIYDRLRVTDPDLSPSSFGTPPRAWFPTSVSGFDGEGKPVTIWVHPVDGRVLGTTPQRPFLRTLVRSLHDSLLVPRRPANIAVNALTILVLCSTITGLITYRRFWKGFLRHPGAGITVQMRAGMWHRLIAVWVSPFLILTMIGSSMFFLNSIGLKSTLPEVPRPAQRDWRLPSDLDGAKIDEVVAIAQHAVPGLVRTVFVLPSHRRAPYTIKGYDKTVGEIFGQLVVTVDPSDNSLLGVARASNGNVMARIQSLAIALHFGTIGGWTTRILWTLFGLGSMALLWTGARVYAARTIAARGADRARLARRGTVSLVIEGLGIFKWAYLLLALGLAAMFVLRFIL